MHRRLFPPRLPSRCRAAYGERYGTYTDPSRPAGRHPQSYVGLDAEAAERQARARGWSTVRALAPGTFITMEFLGGRINFEVDASTVTRCWVG